MLDTPWTIQNIMSACNSSRPEIGRTAGRYFPGQNCGLCTWLIWDNATSHVELSGRYNAEILPVFPLIGCLICTIRIANPTGWSMRLSLIRRSLLVAKQPKIFFSFLHHSSVFLLPAKAAAAGNRSRVFKSGEEHGVF